MERQTDQARRVKMKNTVGAAFLCVGLASTGAHAQVTAPQAQAGSAVSEESSAPVLHAGGVAVYPGLSIVELHNDNLVKRDANKVSSSIMVFSPSALMQAKSAANVYSLSYRADLGRYASSSMDNYDDQSLSGVAELALSSRASLKLSPQLTLGHDDRGSTYSALTPTPNTWHKSGAEGEFTYGAEDAQGRVVFDVSRFDVRYQNNRAVTTAFDKTLTGLGGTFYLRVAPKTFAFVQLVDTRIEYKDVVSSSLTGREDSLLLGVTWKATAQTTGTFKAGQLEKRFNTGLHPTFRGTSWEGSMRWSPREYIRLDLLTSRKSAESTGIGSFVLVTNHSADLAYDLTEQSSLHLVAGKVKEDFAQSGRVDSTPSYGFKAEHKLRKWLKAGAEYARAVKSSSGFTGLNPEYHNNIVSVYLRTEL